MANGHSAPVRLRVVGAHQVGNTLAAAGVGLALGMDVPALAEALGRLRVVSPRRMDVFDRPDGVTVIDDSYNANPASMAAALASVGRLGQGRRTIAVLGYMAELGDHEVAGHEQVGRLAADLGVDTLVVVGEAAPIDAGARSRPGWRGESVPVTDQDAAVAVLRDRLRPGDVVLVKGSRYRTWQVADWLREPVAERRTGWSSGESGRDRRGGRLPGVAVRHAAGHPWLHPAAGRPADPHRRAADPPDQEGHARPWAAWSSSWPRSSRTSPGT